MRYLLALLLPLVAFGQGFGNFRTDQPFLFQAASSAEFTPQSVPGLAYWWVATDCETNVALTNWVDRISGAVMTNGNASTRPTNYSLGVGFDGTRYFTNVALTTANPTVYVVFFRHNRRTDLNTTLAPLFCKLSPGNFAVGFANAASINDTENICYLRPNAPNYQGWTVAPITVNGEENDFAWSIGGEGKGWTNGVSTGAAQGGVSGDVSPTHFTYYSSGNYFAGWVREAMVFTNSVSDADLLKIHQYRLSKYGDI